MRAALLELSADDMIDPAKENELTTARITRRAARFARALATLEGKSIHEWLSQLIVRMGEERFGAETPKPPPKQRRPKK